MNRILLIISFSLILTHNVLPHTHEVWQKEVESFVCNHQDERADWIEAFFTNIGPDHLENFLDTETIQLDFSPALLEDFGLKPSGNKPLVFEKPPYLYGSNFKICFITLRAPPFNS